VKVVINQTPPARGFLRRVFSTQVWQGKFQKEDEVVGAPPHLGCCVSPTTEKGEDLRVNSLIQSQK
jgi:hypothetical protein